MPASEALKSCESFRSGSTFSVFRLIWFDLVRSRTRNRFFGGHRCVRYPDILKTTTFHQKCIKTSLWVCRRLWEVCYFGFKFFEKLEMLGVSQFLELFWMTPQSIQAKFSCLSFVVTQSLSGFAQKSCSMSLVRYTQGCWASGILRMGQNSCARSREGFFDHLKQALTFCEIAYCPKFIHTSCKSRYSSFINSENPNEIWVAYETFALMFLFWNRFLRDDFLVHLKSIAICWRNLYTSSKQKRLWILILRSHFQKGAWSRLYLFK